MIAGHRGALALAPENTLSGIQKAIESNAKWIEIDTQLSADGVPVIFHDESVQRTTNGKGNVSDLTIHELGKLDAGSWFSEEFSGEKIPTLEEVLIFCLDNDININLELKIHHPYQAVSLVEKVSEVITSVNFPIQKLILSSFSLLAMQHCFHLIPTIRRGFITEQNPLPLIEDLTSINLYSIHIEYKILTQSLAQTLIKSGYQLIIWTLNDPLQAKKFKDWGVELIISDRPDAFIDI
tara:strand:+ start:2465 stop:3178 length:714 start_codon:yes stop_codon:yes gene_type:complete